MSLKIYLDDCAYSRRLRQLLEKSGHEVQIPAEVAPPLVGALDETHFFHAQEAGYLILTFNAVDFYELHQQSANHPGILVVYQDNDPNRDMNYADIVKAIANLEQMGVKLASGFWVLNAYQW